MEGIKIYITAFKPTQNIKLSQLYQENYHETLNHHNLKKYVKAAGNYWLSADNVYAVLAHSEDYEIIYGGARLEIKEPLSLLPLEKLLNRKEPEVANIVSNFNKNKVGEAGALWKKKIHPYNPLDISLLIMSVISIMKQLNLKSIIAITSKPIDKIIKNIGLSRYESIGKNGVFKFTGNHLAIFNYYNYPESIQMGEKREMEIMGNLFNCPNQVIKTTENNIKINYIIELNLNSIKSKCNKN